MDNRDNYVYKEYRKNTIKIAVVSLAVLSVCVAIGLYMLSVKKPTSWLGVLGIVCLAAIIFVDRLSSAKFKKNDKTWGRGAKAELDIAKDLGKMENCLIVNGLETERGDIDHVCIAPSGIFTIETKGHYGVISCRDGKLRRNGRDFEKDFINQAKAEKSNLYHLIKKGTGKSYNIVPLIVFANARIDTRSIKGPVDDVWVCRKGFERAVIRKGKESLTGEEMARVYNLLIKIKDNKSNI